MDITILGLLMTGRWTIYEIRKQIETSFSSINSNSMGSIQAAIKKLLENGYITYTEYVENSVNKKAYSITDLGKRQFYDRISEPMLYKEKNKEMGKFFFWGYLESDHQAELLDAYIQQLIKERKALKKIEEKIGQKKDMTIDDEFLEMLRQFGAADELLTDSKGVTAIEKIKRVSRNQFATLTFSLAKIEFEIEWFRNYKETICNKEGKDDRNS